MRRIGNCVRFTLLRAPGGSLSKVLIWGLFHSICKDWVRHQSFRLNIFLVHDSLFRLTKEFYSMPYALWAHISFACSRSCVWPNGTHCPWEGGVHKAWKLLFLIIGLRPCSKHTFILNHFPSIRLSDTFSMTI